VGGAGATKYINRVSGASTRGGPCWRGSGYLAVGRGGLDGALG
jgi:hypothetical protein